MAFAHGFGYGGFGLGFLNFLGTVLFFVALFWAFRFLLRGRYAGRGWRGPRAYTRPWEGEDDAMRAARERFARGEIGEEEFSRLKEGLKKNGRRADRFPFEWLGGGDRALETARLRLARGELSLEEFETLKKALQG